MEVSLHKTSMHILPCQRTVFFLTFFIISFDPQKYKDMIEKVKENEMTTVSELDYIRGLKEGNSVIADFQQ